MIVIMRDGEKFRIDPRWSSVDPSPDIVHERQITQMWKSFRDDRVSYLVKVCCMAGDDYAMILVLDEDDFRRVTMMARLRHNEIENRRSTCPTGR